MVESERTRAERRNPPGDSVILVEKIMGYFTSIPTDLALIVRLIGKTLVACERYDHWVDGNV